jgi:hypothetical protein
MAVMAAGRGLKVSTFVADVTPPLGTPLCYGLVPAGATVDDRLWARGVVLFPAGERPIVLCAVDWLGIGNASRDRWRALLAKAAGTAPERVALHTVHQHDAPGDDLSAHALLTAGVPLYDLGFAREAALRVASAVKKARPAVVTEVTGGAAAVSQVASNRRILGADGKVTFGRMTACRNSAHCAAPEGVIDPLLRSVSFWGGEKRIATLSYYATHPMSYYGKGAISSDFVGQARDSQKDTFQVHFTGAAGNIGAGKYNDGAVANRAVLMGKMAAAMARAKAAEKPLGWDAVRWVSESVAMPLRVGKGFGEEEIAAAIGDGKLDVRQRANHARYLAFLRLTRAGRKIDLTALRIGSFAVLHMPGELFVEYQLAAAGFRPGELVATAAYGDYGPMYIGTARAYEEGGYETSAVSRVGPAVEDVLMGAMRKLLR